MIINLFLLVPKFLLLLLPVLTIDIGLGTAGVLLWFHNVLLLVGAVLPLGDFISIMGVSFVVTNFRFIYTILLRVKSFIPGMGN